MKFIFLRIKALIHVLKTRFIFFFLSFNQILNQLKNQKKTVNIDIDIKKITSFIIRINNFIPNNSCFKESIIIYTFLKNYKDEFEFVIGVKKDSNDNFLSHCWIENCKKPIGNFNNDNFKEILRIR